MIFTTNPGSYKYFATILKASRARIFDFPLRFEEIRLLVPKGELRANLEPISRCPHEW